MRTHEIGWVVIRCTMHPEISKMLYDLVSATEIRHLANVIVKFDRFVLNLLIFYFTTFLTYLLT